MGNKSLVVWGRLWDLHHSCYLLQVGAVLGMIRGQNRLLSMRMSLLGLDNFFVSQGGNE